jgi:hypothetical protein
MPGGSAMGRQMTFCEPIVQTEASDCVGREAGTELAMDGPALLSGSVMHIPQGEPKVFGAKRGCLKEWDV